MKTAYIKPVTQLTNAARAIILDNFAGTIPMLGDDYFQQSFVGDIYSDLSEYDEGSVTEEGIVGKFMLLYISTGPLIVQHFCDETGDDVYNIISMSNCERLCTVRNKADNIYNCTYAYGAKMSGIIYAVKHLKPYLAITE